MLQRVIQIPTYVGMTLLIGGIVIRFILSSNKTTRHSLAEGNLKSN